MIRVVAVNGSLRKGNTHKMLQQIADQLLPQDIEVTILDLAQREIGYCIGCERCIRKTSQCWQDDDAQEILAQLQQADGIILASPVYVMSVSGKLKSLIDKTCSWVHRPPLVGKPALLLATTAGSGLKQTLNYLEQTVVQWGAQPAGKIGRKVSDPQQVNTAELRKFVWHLNHSPHSYRPTLKQLIYYQVQKVLALKVSSIDRQHWQEQGWQKGYYYFACRVPWYKRLIAYIFYRILDYRVHPVDAF